MVVLSLHIVAIKIDTHVVRARTEIQLDIELAGGRFSRLQGNRRTPEPLTGSIEYLVEVRVEHVDYHRHLLHLLHRFDSYAHARLLPGGKSSRRSVRAGNGRCCYPSRTLCYSVFVVGRRVQITANDLAGRTVGDDATLLQQNCALAELGHGLKVVGNEDDSRATLRNRPHFFETLTLERKVANAQHLVDHEDIGLQMRCDGKSESRKHAGRIPLHWRVDEFLESSELDDLVELAL